MITVLKPTRAGIFGVGGLCGPRKNALEELNELDLDILGDAEDPPPPQPEPPPEKKRSSWGWLPMRKDTSSLPELAAVENPLAKELAPVGKPRPPPSSAAVTATSAQPRQPLSPPSPSTPPVVSRQSQPEKTVLSGSGSQLLLNDEVIWERGADPGIPFGTIGRVSTFLKVSLLAFLIMAFHDELLSLISLNFVNFHHVT